MYKGRNNKTKIKEGLSKLFSAALLRGFHFAPHKGKTAFFSNLPFHSPLAYHTNGLVHPLGYVRQNC